MIRFLAIVLFAISSNAAFALDRPIRSCERAPLLPQMQKNLPDHVLGTAAEVQPRLLTRIDRSTIPAAEISKRTPSSLLICIVVAVDAEGKVQDAAISHPRMSLTAKEREQFLKLEYSPAQQDGRAVASLVNIDITLR